MPKCEEAIGLSVILTGGWAAGQNWEGESQIDHWQKFVASEWPEEDLQNFYELDLSVGEAVMDLTSIG